MEAKRAEPPDGGDEPVGRILFVVERGYEEALSLLWAARQRAPDVAEIVRGIQLIKQRLVRRYLCHLGDLDRVPRLAVHSTMLDDFNLEAEELEIVRLVDGVSSYGDIVVESRFGRLETYRKLAELLTRGIIVADGPVVPAEATPAPLMDADAEAEAPLVIDDPDDADVAEASPEVVIQQVKNRHVWWLVAALILVAVGAGTMWWMEGRAGRETEPVSVTVPVAVPVTATATAPEAVTATEAVPVPVPVAVTATAPVAEAVPLTVAVPATARAPVRAPVAEADTDTDTGTDTDTDPATDTAAATVTAPAPATVKATAPPVPAPTRRALPRRQPAARSIAAPSRDVVDQTLARIEPAFRTCYAAARRTGPVRVSLTIDEAGIAHDLETDPGSAPALVDCVRTKSDRLHRGDAPADVGVARVSFTVVQ